MRHDLSIVHYAMQEDEITCDTDLDKKWTSSPVHANIQTKKTLKIARQLVSVEECCLSIDCLTLEIN